MFAPFSLVYQIARTEHRTFETCTRFLILKINLDLYTDSLVDAAKEYQIQKSSNKIETFEKCSILFKFKEGENFNHRNTLSILRIKI